MIDQKDRSHFEQKILMKQSRDINEGVEAFLLGVTDRRKYPYNACYVRFVMVFFSKNYQYKIPSLLINTAS
jgi:hypothetical protein